MRLFVIEIAWLYSLISPFALCVCAFALALAIAIHRKQTTANLHMHAQLSNAHSRTHMRTHLQMTYKHKTFQSFRQTTARVSIMLCACSKCEQAAQYLPSPCASKQVDEYKWVCSMSIYVCVWEQMYLGQLLIVAASVRKFSRCLLAVRLLWVVPKNRRSLINRASGECPKR